MTMESEGEKAWFYLTPDGQHHGPFEVDAMKELFKQQYITEDALVWAEGEGDWLPLKASHDLYSALAFQDDGKKTAPVDADLAAFQAEIAAIEGNEAPDRAESPPPDEREFEDDDGTVFVWDSALRKFKPRDEPLPATGPAPSAGPAQAAEYTADMMVFERDEEVIPTIQQAREAEEASVALAEKLAESKPATTGRSSEADESGKRAADAPAGPPDDKRQKPEEPAWFQPKNNTNVYVTGIPDDATIEEIAEVFGRCGIIKPGDNDEPRIKLYKDKKTGMMKGDCLISYLQVPSVNLAVKFMDGRQLRPGSGPMMTVQEAKFEQKGDYVPKKRQLKKADKKKLQAKKERLLNWGGFDDKAKAEEVTVVLYNMFSLEDMVLNPDVEGQLVQDVLEQSKRFGTIDLVKAFNTNPEGVMWIKFRLPDSAKACIDAMNGRFYAGRQIKAELWDGKKKFNVSLKESAEEEAARLKAFAEELEGQE